MSSLCSVRDGFCPLQAYKHTLSGLFCQMWCVVMQVIQVWKKSAALIMTSILQSLFAWLLSLLRTPLWVQLPFFQRLHKSSPPFTISLMIGALIAEAWPVPTMMVWPWCLIHIWLHLDGLTDGLGLSHDITETNLPVIKGSFFWQAALFAATGGPRHATVPLTGVH